MHASVGGDKDEKLAVVGVIVNRKSIEGMMPKEKKAMKTKRDFEPLGTKHWIVRDLIPEGHIVLVIGQPGSG